MTVATSQQIIPKYQQCKVTSYNERKQSDKISTIAKCGTHRHQSIISHQSWWRPLDPPAV